MISAYRVTKAKHQHQAFSGIGGLYASGRWHHKGTTVVYGSESCALSALELFVHLQDEAKQIPFASIHLDIPEDLVVNVEDMAALPKRWRSEPPGQETKKIGTNWAKSLASPVLSVPSAIITVERNYIFNPSHPDFGKLALGPPTPFSFDARLWK